MYRRTPEWREREIDGAHNERIKQILYRRGPVGEFLR